MTPDQINHLIKAGRLRMRPIGAPGQAPAAPGMPPAVGAAMPMDSIQYRAELCMQEINAACQKYRCRLIPRIVIDKMAGIDGIVSIVPVDEEGKAEGMGAMNGQADEPPAPPAPPAAPVDPATLSNDEIERIARENLERERAKLRTERENTPDQEA